jgi:diamine N-acetyltransferase
MILLRALRAEDSNFMMEYINDAEISSNFKFTRYPFSQEGFRNFIEKSWSDRTNIHFAIEADEYAGTISLKNINNIDRTGEYAIVVRKKFWGTGIAKEATEKIIQYGFNTLNLEKIYLNVLTSNTRANKFYQKMGFDFEGSFKRHVFVEGKYEDLNWYCIFKKKDDKEN